MPPAQDKTVPMGSCERCGRPIVFDKFTLCYDCRGKEKKEMDKALDYLAKHRGATLAAVATATGVDPQLVLKLIRGGSMEVVKKKLRGKS